MKKLIIALAMMFATTVAHAETITLINTGKPGGSSDARTKLYHEGLTNMGYDVQFENINKIGQSVDFFQKLDGPAMMVYVNIYAKHQPVTHNTENFVMVEYVQPLFVCSARPLAELGDEVTVAYGKTYNPEMVQKIVELTGKRAKVVPYKNSSAVLEAMLGGDVDIAFNNQGKTLKYIKSGKGTCFGNTSDNEVIGVAPLADNYNVDFELPIMVATVISKGMNVDKLRKDLLALQKTAPFVEYHSKKKLAKFTKTRQEELDMVVASEAVWK